MKLIVASILTHFALGNPILEFGRDISVQTHNERLGLDDPFGMDELRLLFDLEDMSMSMSMSFSYPAITPTKNPASPSVPSSPTTTTNPAQTPSLAPNSSPLVPASLSPTPSPALSPSSLMPTRAPTVSTTPTVTASPSIDMPIFECSNGVVVPGTLSNETTALALIVVYAAESTSTTTDTFLEELEQWLFSIAVEATLQCDNTTRRQLQGRRLLSTATHSLGPCNTTAANAKSCSLLETDMNFMVNKALDVDFAEFLAYSALRGAMANYTAGTIVTLERVTYIAPLPEAPLSNLEQVDVTTKPSQSRSVFSPWTIGACVALSVGGLLAVTAFAHNRRTRQNQHQALVEDQSLSPVSLFSAERDMDMQA